MAKRDESLEAPRRGRPKRSGNAPPPPPPPQSRMEMMLAAAATAESAGASSYHAPQPATGSAHNMYHQAYPQHQPQQAQYHSYAQLQQQQMSDRSGDASKRKRAKKSGDDEWPPAPTAAPSGGGGMRIDSLMAPQSMQPSMAPAVPVAAPSSSMHSISSLTGGPPPPEFKMPVSSASLSSILSASASSPVASAPSPSVSVFQAVPTIIQSFAETERRRNSASSANGSAGGNSGSMNISILTHGNGKSAGAGATARGTKSDERSGSGASANRAAQLTMLDLFFPSAAGRANGGDSNGSSRDPSKSLKRKRRVESAATAGGSSSGRTSRRSNEAEQLGAASTAVEYDMLRFGVDSSKLIPQGLVDRVDAKMDRAFISRLIRSHVENWIKRAGFGSSFLSELTTLLTAYYPCHYPTILDEVFAYFLFKRPEFTELLLKPMLEKLQKTGESATGAKYPVVDALARTCSQATAGGASERARHDFACETLLQCLLERNTEKFILSSAVAACAANCSDAVLEKLWRQILGSWVTESDDASQDRPGLSKGPGDLWQIVDPTQQAFELLDEERKTRLRGDHHVGGGCPRLASAFTRLALLDVKFRDEATVMSSSILQQALEVFFGHGSTLESSALLLDRVSCLADNSDKEFAQLLKFLVNSTAKLSVKKTNWFSRHVLRFLLSRAHATPRRKKLLAEVAHRYMPLLLGAPEKDARLQNPSQASATKSSSGAATKSSGEDSSASQPRKKSKLLLPEDTSAQGPWDTLEIVEKHSVAEIVEKIETLLDLLEGAHPTDSAAFLEPWTSAWSSKASQVSVPWPYVHAMMLVAVSDKTAENYRIVHQGFQSLVLQTCRKHFRDLRTPSSSEQQKAVEIVSRFTDALHLLLSSPNESAPTLLREIVGALRLLDEDGDASLSSRGSSIFSSVVLVCLGEGKRVDAWKSSPTKRGGSQKNAQESPAAATQRSPQTEVELQVLVSLLDLATLEDETGRFVRAQLSSRPTVRLLARLLHDVSGNRYKMSKLIDLLDAVVTQRQGDSSSSTLGREWCRQHIVQQLVVRAYSVDTLAFGDRLVGLLQSLAQRSIAKSMSGGAGDGEATTLLWVTLRQCTRFCCGCSAKSDSRSFRSGEQQQLHFAVASNFAELVKVVLCTWTSTNGLLADSVGEFVEQELSSCHSREGMRMNLFLLLLLQKMARIERQPRSCISAVQVAVFSIGKTTHDNIRVLQLQLLKALCSRLVGMRHRRGAASASLQDDGDDCRNWEELVCNERLQLDLRRIVSAEGVVGASGSRTSIVLAQGVLKFVAEVNRGKRREPVTTR